MQSMSLTCGQPTKTPVCHHTSCQPTSQGQPTSQPERAATSKFNNPSCSLHRSQQTLRRINHSWPLHWCSVSCAWACTCACRSPHSPPGHHLTWQMQARTQMFAGNLWKKGSTALERTIPLEQRSWAVHTKIHRSIYYWWLNNKKISQPEMTKGWRLSHWVKATRGQ